MDRTGIRFRPGLALTLATAAVGAILLVLGGWQLGRHDEKQALIASVMARRDLAPVTLPAALPDPQMWQFRPVRLTGTFRHRDELLVTSHAEQGRIGYRVLTPLLRDDGPAVWVDRGWVPQDFARAGTRMDGQVAGSVTLTGLVRLPAQPGWLTPDPDPATRTWFAADIQAMSAAVGLDGAMPVYVVADDMGLTWPRAEGASLNLENTHLGYALTWYGIALGLLGVYVMLGLERGRRRP